MIFSAIASTLVKLAGPTHAEKIDEFHSMMDKDWKGFEKNLKAKRFQKATLEHSMTDNKLKRYVKNYGGYLTSKNVVGVVPSRTSSKLYKVKELPSGRLACGCRDWQYSHSVRNTDCEHIKELKQGLEKLSQYQELARGFAAARSIHKARENKTKGALVRENERRLRTGEQLIPVGYR